MMCDLALCTTSGDIRPLHEGGCLRVMAGYISGRPFSVLIIDKRTGEHLHLPYEDYVSLIQDVKRKGKRPWRRL